MIIIISVLVVMLLNVYFWFYCIFCRKNKQCGDIQYFVTVIHKKQNSSSCYPLKTIMKEEYNGRNDNSDNENSVTSGLFEEMSNFEDVRDHGINDLENDEDNADWETTQDIALLRPLPPIPEDSIAECGHETEITIKADVHMEQSTRNVSQHTLPPPSWIKNEEHVYNVLDPQMYTDDMPMPSVMYE